MATIERMQDTVDGLMVALAVIEQMPPAPGTYDAENFTLRNWRDRARDMARIAREALHTARKRNAAND